MQKDNYLYAITFKDGTILSPESFKVYWPNYGNNSLYGWRKPKKIYTELKQAKTGFSHIPKELKLLVQISKFKFDGSVISGGDLANEQAKRKEEKTLKYKTKEAERAKKESEEKIKRMEQELAQLLDEWHCVKGI